MIKNKRKQVKIQKEFGESEESEEEVVKKTPVRKTRTRGGKEVNEEVEVVIERKTHEKGVNVVVESSSITSKARGKIGRQKKNDNDADNVNQKEDDDDDDFLNSEGEKDEEEENEDNDDDYQSDEKQDDYSSTEQIEHEKPYYGGRKKLPPRAAATQKIDYSDNHYYHEFQDYFYLRVDDDEPKRRKSLSTPTRKRSSREMYSDDDNFSGNSDMSSSSQDLRSSRSKKPRKKRLPHRGSKEKGIDYSESKYYRQFDSAMNAKLWTDKLLDEDDEDDENDTNNKQDTNKKRGGNEKNKKSAISTPVNTSRRTPVSTPQKIQKNRSVRAATSRTSVKDNQSHLSEDEQGSDHDDEDEQVRGFSPTPSKYSI